MVYRVLPRTHAICGGSGETQPASLVVTFCAKQSHRHYRVMSQRKWARCVVGWIVIRRHNALSDPLQVLVSEPLTPSQSDGGLVMGRNRAGDRRAAALLYGSGEALSLPVCTACARGWWRRDDRLRGLHEGTESCPRSRSPHRSRWLQQKTGAGRPG